MKNTVYKEVKEVLEAANVCRRCILRFFGSKEYTNFITAIDVENAIQQYLQQDIPNQENVTEVMLTDENDCSSPKRFLATPCAACLGILQGVCDGMVSKIDDCVSKRQHQFKNFVLQVSLPVVLDLRNKLFQYYLNEKIGSQYCCEVPSVKDICKWVIGSQYGKLKSVEFTPDSDFQIYISSVYPNTAKECIVLFKKCPGAFPNAKKRKASEEQIYSKAAILQAMDSLSSEINELYALPPSPPEKSCSFGEVQCTHSPLYLGGRYNKYSRELSQTPWILDGERLMESSINELITDVVLKHILCDKIVFSASGREDVDVKMLGNGRPFVLEILNPRRVKWSEDEMTTIENQINNGTKAIAVKNLQVISKADTVLLKEGEEKKKKTYLALCLVSKKLCQDDVTKLGSLKELTLHQKTPIRVLHRRTLSTRERVIHSMEANVVDDHHMLLKLETQAGTYVKEFVNSDLGRTTPSLGTLLETDADILELDVESIDLDWPPSKTDS